MILRAFRPEDLPAFVAYRRDPAVARYQSWAGDFSMADAERFLAGMAGVELGEPGVWMQHAIVDRADGSLAGDCASHMQTDPPRTVEIGVTVAPARQGAGVAGEATSALVAALFERCGAHRVFAQADERNAPVHRLLERVGFRCEARLVEADWFKGEWTTLRVYALLEREWRERCARPGRARRPA